MPSKFKASLSALKAEHIWGIATVAVVAILSMIIIAVFRKPGHMGLVESQSMNMSNMRPPAGAVPVAIATVDDRPIDGSVIYTGTVQSFTDEDVYPRLTGRIVSEPVYPGDKVRKGQLLVQLDPANSEYASKAREAALAARAEKHNEEIAREESQGKQAQAKAAVAAQTAAKRALDQAQANLDYWTTEITREKTLLDQQVVSKQEYDSEFSQYEQAKAQVAQATAKVEEAAHNQVAAADEAQAGMHHSMHQSEEAQRAKAEAQTAAIVQSYTRIYASDNGIVTKRMIAPGVVVSPGMVILRIAHIDQVRVQAQVSEQDLGRIPIGSSVTIKTSQSANPITSGTVTAKFPSADPSTRTFIIESLVRNPGNELLPGQYVVMSFGTGAAITALTVPSTAIVWSGSQAQVWKAVGGEQRATAQLQNVEVGNSNDQYTQILSGLTKGERVIYQGQSGLAPGMAVVAVQWGAAGPVTLPTPAEASAVRMTQANKWIVNQTPDDIRVRASMQPLPPKSSENSVVFAVTDRNRTPVKGASVKASTSMPTMNMPGPVLQAKETADGTYQFESNFMSGLWSMDVTISVNGKQTKFSVEADVP